MKEPTLYENSMGNAFWIRNWSYIHCRSVQNYQQLMPGELRNEVGVHRLKYAAVLKCTWLPWVSVVYQKWFLETGNLPRSVSQQRNIPVYGNERKTFIAKKGAQVPKLPKLQSSVTMALNCSSSWEWWERKRPKQGTKANASLEDAATVCQHLCQLFKMQFFIFIMRSNLNAWHFLCGGLTLSPQILQWPLVCHWKATNLSVTTSDVSPVILPLAFQKQLLHSHHSQQINLCVLPAHRLLSAPPSPAPLPVPPLRSPAAAFRSPLCHHCFALRLSDGA